MRTEVSHSPSTLESPIELLGDLPGLSVSALPVQSSSPTLHPRLEEWRKILDDRTARGELLREYEGSLIKPLAKALARKISSRPIDLLENDLLITLNNILSEDDPFPSESGLKIKLSRRVIDEVRKEGSISRNLMNHIKLRERAAEQLSHDVGGPISATETLLAEHLGVDPTKLSEIEIRHQVAAPLSETQLGQGGTGRGRFEVSDALSEFAVDGRTPDAAILEGEEASTLLPHAPRSIREIVVSKWVDGKLLSDVASARGVTPSAITQEWQGFVKGVHAKIIESVHPEEREMARIILRTNLSDVEIAAIHDTDTSVVKKLSRFIELGIRRILATPGIIAQLYDISTQEIEPNLSKASLKLQAAFKIGHPPMPSWKTLNSLPIDSSFFKEAFVLRSSPAAEFVRSVIALQGPITTDKITERMRGALREYLGARYANLDQVELCQPIQNFLGSSKSSEDIAKQMVRLDLVAPRIPDGQAIAVGNRLSYYLSNQVFPQEIVDANLRIWLAENYGDAARITAHRALATLLGTSLDADHIRKVVLRREFLPTTLPNDFSKRTWSSIKAFFEADTVGESQRDENLRKYLTCYSSVEDIARNDSVVEYIGVPNSTIEIAKAVFSRGLMSREVQPGTPLTVGARLNFYYDPKINSPEDAARNLGIYVRSVYPDANQVDSKNRALAKLLGVPEKQSTIVKALFERGFLSSEAPADAPLSIRTNMNYYFSAEYVGVEQANKNLKAWVLRRYSSVEEVPPLKALATVLGVRAVASEVRPELIRRGIFTKLRSPPVLLNSDTV